MRANAMAVIGAMGVLVALGWPVAASSPPTEPIELPDTLSSGLTALDLAEAYPRTLDADTVEERLADRRSADEFNARGHSEALGGVSAAARGYASEELDLLYSVVAVGAELSPLLPPEFVDPARLGLAKPLTEHVPIGEVSCLVGWSVIPADDEPTDADRQNVVCQATGDGVTVRINASTGETPEHVAELATELLESIS